MSFPNLRATDYDSIFDAMDVNNDGQLSVLEFGLYIKGAKKPRTQNIGKLTEEMKKEIETEINKLFSIFDKNKDGKISDSEVV